MPKGVYNRTTATKARTKRKTRRMKKILKPENRELLKDLLLNDLEGMRRLILEL